MSQGWEVPSNAVGPVKAKLGWASEEGDDGKHTGGPYDPDYPGQDLDGTATLVEGKGAPLVLEAPASDPFSSITITVNASVTFARADGVPFAPGMSMVGSYIVIFTPGAINSLNIICAGVVPPPTNLEGLGGVMIVPNLGTSDQDIPGTNVGYSATTVGAGGVQTSSGNIPICIDAVADLPENTGEVSDDIIHDDFGDDKDYDYKPESEFTEGVATQVWGRGLTAEDTALSFGTAKFHDLDGSEEHFVLIRSENDGTDWKIDVSQLGHGEYAAFEVPADGILKTMWLDADGKQVPAGTAGAVEYYKVNIADTYLNGNGGEVEIKLPLHFGEGTENGLHRFDLKAGSKERLETPSDVEYDGDNNLALQDLPDIDLAVLVFKSQFKVSMGWVYESGATSKGTNPDPDNLNPDANPEGWGAGKGQPDQDFSMITTEGRATASAAFIKVEFPEAVPGETISDIVTFTYDASRGSVYFPNGMLVSSVGPDGKASASFNRSVYERLFGSGDEIILHFVPNKDSDDDSDVLITYDFKLITTDLDGNPVEIPISNTISVVIDAVVDAADVTLVPDMVPPAEFDGFILNYEAEFHADDTEQQYLIIPNLNGLLELNLGSLAAYLSVASAAELKAYDNPDAGARHYFDGLNDEDYIILKVDNLTALDAADGMVDGKVSIEFPFTVTDRDAAGEDITVTVDSVVVEGKGNVPGAWSPERPGGDEGEETPGEYDFANNISVTSKDVVVHLSEAAIRIEGKISPVYEGDRAEQHISGDADAPEIGTVLNLQMRDSHEAIHEIFFTAQTNDSSDLDGNLTFGQGSNFTIIPQGGGLRFASELEGENACYTKAWVLDSEGNTIKEYTIDPPATLAEINAGDGYSGLRFIPSGTSNSDADIQVDFTGRIMDVRSGDTLSIEDSLPLITRDAVADLPLNASSHVTPPSTGHTAFEKTATIEIGAQAVFGDLTDGSEAHYIFVSREFLDSLEIPDALSGFFIKLTDAEAADICAQVDGANGIPGANSSAENGYFVIKVDPDYLQSQNGSVDLKFETTIKGDAAKDAAELIDIKVVAVEHDGFKTSTSEVIDAHGNTEANANNNVSVVDISASVEWATLENTFSITAKPVYENDQPEQHLGDTTHANGTIISIVPGDSSEVFDTLTIQYRGEDGQDAAGQLVLTVGSQTLAIPAGTTLVFDYDTANPTLCVKVSYVDAGGGTHAMNIVPGQALDTLTSNGLRYIPDVNGNHSDIDVAVTFSGTTRETVSGETGEFKSKTVQILVDAVADKAQGSKTAYDYSDQGTDPHGNQYTALPGGSAVKFAVDTIFADYADGSEKHYLFINSKFLVDGTLVVIDDTTGVPFAGGSRITGQQLADLYEQINGNPGLVPQGDDAYVVLEVSDEYLASHGGKLNLTVTGTLKDADELADLGPSKTELDMDVKAVAVEHEGYKTPETDATSTDNDEYRAENNVAVTDVGTQFRWDDLQNQFVLVTEVAHEGDQPSQHEGNMVTEGGALLTITPADAASEIFTRMDLGYSDVHGNMTLTADNPAGNAMTIILSPGVDILFTYDAADPTLITKVTCGSTSIDVYAPAGTPGMTLADLTSNGFRYVPHTGDNDDADIHVTIHADVKKTTTGVTGEATLEGTVTVDAVADMPENSSTTLNVTNGKGNTIIVNDGEGIDSFEIVVKTTFNDYTDGSERHFIFVNSEYLSNLDGISADLTMLSAADAATILANAGLIGDYFVLEVDPNYLSANNGTVNVTLTAHLDPATLPGEETNIHVDIKVGALEHQGINTQEYTDLGVDHGKDSLAANNVALQDLGVDLEYAKLDKTITATAGDAYEGDQSKQHEGSTIRDGGAKIILAPDDTSEVFDSLTLNYDDSEGTIFLDLAADGTNIRVALPDGALVEFAYRNVEDGVPPCRTVTVTIEGDSTTYTLTPSVPMQDITNGGRLHYIPDVTSQDDSDISLTVTGTIRETATDESGSFSKEIIIKVDAVADKPDAESTAVNKDGDYSALECDTNANFDLTIQVNFGKDTQDDSEAHYIFISKKYLDGINIPAALAGVVEELSAADANIVCGQIDGIGGIPGADADDYFVLKVDNAYLEANGGSVNLPLEGNLKSSAELTSVGASEGDALTFDIKAVAVEHGGFETPENTLLGDEHGVDTKADNNVSVDDASVPFTYAKLDGNVIAVAKDAYEGDQSLQYQGDWATLEGGAFVTIAPEDSSEVFQELTLSYDSSHGSLMLGAPNGTVAEVKDGARLVFTFDPDHPAECLSVDIYQPGSSTPITIPTMTDTGRGMSLSDLTSGYLRYVPDTGDNDDQDVTITFNGSILETESGAEGSVTGNVTVVVDAVADKATNTDAVPVIFDALGNPRDAIRPDLSFEIKVTGDFKDYGEQVATDTAENHYVFISKEHLAELGGLPGGIAMVTDPATLEDLFNDIALSSPNDRGIHAGPDAADDYYVLNVTHQYLKDNGGHLDITLTAKAQPGAEACGTHQVDTKLVSVEHDGYATKTKPDDIDGSEPGTDKDSLAHNNVAVADESFTLIVREFEPEQVVVVPETEWAFENDRHAGHEEYHPAGDNSDRDLGVRLIFAEGPGEGNKVASITIEYPMPSNGSSAHHKIVSFDEETGMPSDGVTITYSVDPITGTVTATITADNPYGSVGELHFIPGDNYDNDDVDLTVVNVVVSDPALGTNTNETPVPNWGDGVVDGKEDFHVNIDAVAQQPGIEITGLDTSVDTPIKAGEKIHIKGNVSFEDLADGSEEHFLLLEIVDGFYPDSVTLTYNGVSVVVPVVHYQPPTDANYMLQELITEDDGKPHLFIKLAVDDKLTDLMGGSDLERMDGIKIDATYQTREWAEEATALRFAAVSTEDVEEVREYDVNYNITNEELPFDDRMAEIMGQPPVDHPNNTAIGVASETAYVYWDSNNPSDVSCKDYAYENDRPDDHVRDDVYVRRDMDGIVPDIAINPPLAEELVPYDTNNGRNYGTVVTIPDNAASIHLTQTPGYPEGHGDFFLISESAYQEYMDSGSTDGPRGAIKVNYGETVKVPGNEYILVFIPKNEPYDAAHSEQGNTHKDIDVHFDYTIIVPQYGPNGEQQGVKRYVGSDEVVRVDAVANQAENIQAGDLASTDVFSMWGGGTAGKTNTFPLTVKFHDLGDQNSTDYNELWSEQHYALLEVVVNFEMECNGYVYDKDNIDSIYTHVMTDEFGVAHTIRYYKVPVHPDQIDPVTGEVTLDVTYNPYPGAPRNADYPTSENLSFGALTADGTCTIYDSTDPNADNFVNRIGADGEFSYDNNTSVIIRNGVENGDREDGHGDGEDGGSFSGPGTPELYPGSGPGGGIHFPGNPTGGGEYIPVGGSGPGSGDNPGGPASGGDLWRPGSGGGGNGTTEGWSGGGDFTGGGGGDGGGGKTDPTSPDYSPASRGEGLAFHWVFENATPLGHTEWGQYPAIMPTRIDVDCRYPDGTPNYNAEWVEITIPGVNAQLIDWNPNIAGIFTAGAPDFHARGILGTTANGLITDITQHPDGSITFRVHAPDGRMPEGVDLYFLHAPDSLDTDFEVGVKWFDKQDRLMSDGTVDVLVDAVAQWANFALEKEDGVYGVTGKDPKALLDIKMVVNFIDQDGSESNYVIIEKVPGVLPLHVIGYKPDGTEIFDKVQEVYLEGKTYFVISPTADELANNELNLKVSVNEGLTSPMYVKDVEYNGEHFNGIQMNVGTMTVEGSKGEPGNWEYSMKNNTSINLEEKGLTIVISDVNAKGGNNTIIVDETATPEDAIVKLDPANPSSGLNLSMDSNDVLVSLVFTELTGNGGFWYIDEQGQHHPVPLNTDMAQAYLEGRIYHKQDRYEDSDASMKWTALVRDPLSDTEKAVDGKLTIAVDAVADKAEIHTTFPVLDNEAGTLSMELSFDDHAANEIHYAVVMPDMYRVVGDTAIVFDADGNPHSVPVETIFDPSGKPYLAVRVDGYQDADGHVRVQFAMRELNIENIEDYPIVTGGISIEPNTGYEDREPDLTDNFAVNTKPSFPHAGNVTTKGLVFVIDKIVEDDAQGAGIDFRAQSTGENDVILSAELTFTPRAGTEAFAPIAGHEASGQIATILYNGQCYAVTLDGTGNAVAAIDFGTGGFDDKADFRIIWGIAHMQNGKVVVDAYNHAANGSLDLNTDFTVFNALSGVEQTLHGKDANAVPLTPTTDAGENIVGEITQVNGVDVEPGQLVGAGNDTVTIKVQGNFVDVDGSEDHFLLLEQREGWQLVSPAGCEVITMEDRKEYYAIKVDSTESNPSADFVLKAPAGGSKEETFRTGSVVSEGTPVEEGSLTLGNEVIVQMSGVSAVGLDVASLPDDPILEDGLYSLADFGNAALVGADANDVLRSVTFTNLQGGSIVDADGVATGRDTFTQAELASGDFHYKPRANHAGDVTLNYSAQLGETNTGATKTVTGVLGITITPEADAPTNLNAVVDNTDIGTAVGHVALVPVTLQASFADTDGSEMHFFVVAMPSGAVLQDGPGYALVPLSPEDLAALGGRFPAGADLYKVVLNSGTTSPVSLTVDVAISTTIWNGGSVIFVGGSSEPVGNGDTSYAFSGQQTVNLPPALESSAHNTTPEPVADTTAIDTLRDSDWMVEDRIEMSGVDADGDTVSVNGLRFGGNNGIREVVDGRGCFTVRGDHGTLHLFDNGEYRYVLDADKRNTVDEEVFTFTLRDEYTGTGESTITVSLTANNANPAADPTEESLQSVRMTEVSGELAYRDSDGDAVRVVNVDGDTTLETVTTPGGPRQGYEVTGTYGTLQVYEDGGEWKYRYTLDPAHRGVVEAEEFTFTIQDAFGGSATETITIDLYNDNQGPVAGAGSSSMDALRDQDGEVAGSVSLRDPEGDRVFFDGITGPNGPGVWSASDNAYVVQGQYGTLYLTLAASGGGLQYRYVLTDPSAAGVDATETFTYAVNDGHLGTGSNLITIDLNNTNNEPVVTGDLTMSLDTQRSATGMVSGNLEFADPDFNVDLGRNDAVTMTDVSFGGVPGTRDEFGGFTVDGAHGVLHVNADGTYYYTLNQGNYGLTGTEDFTVSVTDEFGAVHHQSVVIDLVTVNANPTATAGDSEMDTWRDGPLVSGSVTFQDADDDLVKVDSAIGAKGAGTMGLDPNNAPAFVVEGQFGTLYLHEDGSYLYALADPGVKGKEAFTFTVGDGYGGSGSNTITIDLDNANTGPEIDGDLTGAIAGAFEDYPDGKVSVEGKISWTDAENDTISSIAVNGTTVATSGATVIAGQYGSLEMNPDGTYTYTLYPGMDKRGIDDVERFEVVVTDAYGASQPEDLAISLKPLTHIPTCADLNVEWQSGLSAIFDTLPFEDGDAFYNPNEILELVINGRVITPDGVAIQGEYGILTVYPDGMFSYTSDVAGQPLMDHFTYIVTDAEGNRGQANIYIRLSDDAPPFPNPVAEPHAESADNVAAPTALSGMETLLDFDEAEDLLVGTTPEPGAAAQTAMLDLPESDDLALTLGELLPPDSAADSLDSLLPVTASAKSASEGMDMETLAQTLSQPPTASADSTDAAAAASSTAVDMPVPHEPGSTSAEQAMMDMLIKNISG